MAVAESVLAAERRCACGCGGPLPAGSRGTRRYYSNRCRARQSQGLAPIPWVSEERVSADPISDPLEGLTGGARVAEFFRRNLVHVSGRWAGKPFELQKWQRVIVDKAFGTFDKQGQRRYREVLLGVPRKNGKSSLAAGLALYALCADGEFGAEVYSLAGSRDQARIVFDVARRMVNASAVLSRELRVWKNHITYDRREGVYRVLSREDKTAHGYSPSFAIVDELHVHRDGNLYETIQTGMGARDQPMLFAITTAGYDRTSILWKRLQHGLAGKDRRFLLVWFEAPAGCELEDYQAWKKANPSPWRRTRTVHREALTSGLEEAAFRRLYLNQFTDHATRTWLPEGAWRKCSGLPEIPRGAPVIVGVDASLKRDTTAVAMVRRDSEGVVHVRAQTFQADEDVGMVDLEEIENVIRELSKNYELLEVVFDPFGFGRSAQTLLAEGIPMVEYGQSSSRMAPATDTLRRIVLEGRLRHGDDPVMTRHARAAVVRDTEYGARLDKRRSGESMDAMIALAMAAHRIEADPMVVPEVSFFG